MHKCFRLCIFKHVVSLWGGGDWGMGKCVGGVQELTGNMTTVWREIFVGQNFRGFRGWPNIRENKICEFLQKHTVNVTPYTY